MHTVYDWLTVALFGGLIVLFLQRSTQEQPIDKLWHYLPPAVGCAVVNYLGNNGDTLAAIVVLVATLAYVVYVLKPFPSARR